MSAALLSGGIICRGAWGKCFGKCFGRGAGRKGWLFFEGGFGIGGVGNFTLTGNWEKPNRLVHREVLVLSGLKKLLGVYMDIQGRLGGFIFGK